MKIAIFATGGTFDKEYNELGGDLFYRKSHIQEILSRGRCRLPTRVEVLMMKDSLQMTDEDRSQILAACLSCEESRIVIAHGSDTMEQTARFLEGKVRDKTIVLTGAMIPYAFGNSDAVFNLGSALSFVQTLSSGVFVAMNGRIFSAEHVRKDRKKGIFVKGRGRAAD